MPVELIDVSHDVEDGMITYPGLPAPIVGDFLSFVDSRARYAPGTEFLINRIELVGNTGTYLDAPRHRYPTGRDLAALPLDRIANLDAVVIRASDRVGRAIDRDAFASVEVRGKAVLVQTGWDVHWRTDRYFEGHPFLTRAAAECLVAAGAALVGIDSLNIDDTGAVARPVHTLLLGADVPIVEHLCNLGALPDGGFRFFTVPVKVRGCGSFPVRAFGVVER
jgi:arylformamidase